MKEVPYERGAVRKRYRAEEVHERGTVWKKYSICRRCIDIRKRYSMRLIVWKRYTMEEVQYGRGTVRKMYHMEEVQ